MNQAVTEIIVTCVCQPKPLHSYDCMFVYIRRKKLFLIHKKNRNIIYTSCIRRGSLFTEAQSRVPQPPETTQPSSDVTLMFYNSTYLVSEKTP